MKPIQGHKNLILSLKKTIMNMKSEKNILQDKMSFLGNKKLKFQKHNRFLKSPEQDVIKKQKIYLAIWL
jgi:hypothetical protein